MSDSKTIAGVRTDHKRRYTFPWLAVLGLVTLIWLGLVLAASLNYPGNQFVFLLFVASYTLMLAIAFPRPRLYGYTFLAAFLFLGFCLKSVAYLGLGMALVEPTGSFDGSGYAWDSALSPAIAGSVAVIAIRLLHLVFFRSQSKAASPLGLPPPPWYMRLRIPVLVASVAGLVLINMLNLVFALYQIGISPRLVPPGHLSVLIEWLFVIGLAMWASTLVGWEAQVSPGRFGSILLIPLGEAFGSVSTLSRSWYLFRGISYLLVAAEFPTFFRTHLARHWRLVLLVLLPVGFAAYLTGVSLLRIAVYPVDFQVPGAAASASPAPSPTPAVRPQVLQVPGQVTNTRLQLAARELGLLVVGRWIGIEGTMAVSSYQGLSYDFFQRALTEEPSMGESALYQRLAGSYRTTNSFVFLTTPGAIAVLYYSGSLPVVAIGMAIITALLISFEMAAARLLRNAFTVSIVAMSVANAIAQMQFPYLFGVFLLEQAVAVAALVLISRVTWSRSSRVLESALPSERAPRRRATINAGR
jgi:hypothetical protein